MPVRTLPRRAGVTTTLARLVGALRRERGVFRAAAAVVAAHVLDDTLVQPPSGTPAGDHLVSAVVPVALIGLAAWAYPRLSGFARAALALAFGLVAVAIGLEGAYYTSAVGPSGDDFTGLLALGAGVVLLGLGAVTLWRTRRTEGTLLWRYPRRALLAVGAFLAFSVVVLPLGLAYVTTHTARAVVPENRLGVAYENVSFRTSDGLRLEGWYVPSRNGAAVVSFPGRKGPQRQARMLARHGYGVLLFDRRGEGRSEGEPNAWGWSGERDIKAAVAFLRHRRDVDPARIGGIGLSVGGENMIEAAAESQALRAIVSEGASARSVRDDLDNGAGWQNVLGDGVATAATALFSDNAPPQRLRTLVPKIHGAVFFVYGQKGQPAERPANRAYYAAARGPKQIWEVPGSGHIGGIDARPAEYEQRVVGFFDRTLLGG
jgi:uncharacterized protein